MRILEWSTKTKVVLDQRQYLQKYFTTIHDQLVKFYAYRREAKETASRNRIFGEALHYVS